MLQYRKDDLPILSYETKADFEKRKGKIHETGDRCTNGQRFTSYSAKYDKLNRSNIGENHIKGRRVGFGYIIAIGTHKVKKDYTCREITQLVAELQPHEQITEQYPTRFCLGVSKNSGISCLQSLNLHVQDEQRAQLICTKCGLSSKMQQYNYGNGKLGEDGKVNRNNQSHAPPNTTIGTTTSGAYHGHGQNGSSKRVKLPAHHSNFDRIDKIIVAIADMFEGEFSSLVKIVGRARHKLSQFYSIIHAPTVNDDNAPRRMPHGQAALAGACFYVANREHEASAKYETPATLARIVDYANSEVIPHYNGGRNTRRNVKIRNIIQHAHTLAKHGLVNPNLIEEAEALSLRWKPEHRRVHHTRMALFALCDQVETISYSKKKKLGVSLCTTPYGVLQIDNIKPDGYGWSVGLRQGHYLISFQGVEIPVEETPKSFAIKCQAESKADCVVFTLQVRKKL